MYISKDVIMFIHKDVFTFICIIYRVFQNYEIIGGVEMNSNNPFKKRDNPFANKKAVQSNERDKYTATMDREVRKRVKVASAMKGVQFSQFVEEACLEKLEREEF